MKNSYFAKKTYIKFVKIPFCTIFVNSKYKNILMNKEYVFPDFILESSWEVCNKVGGIYTVLSTRAKTLKKDMGDNVVYIGPDCRVDKSAPFFEEDDKLLGMWTEDARREGLEVRTGRWNIPGSPIAVLVKFDKYYERKNDIYAYMWENYQVDSLHAYGDYDEASMFSYAAALVVESLYNNLLKKYDNVVYHCNEWMTALGMLYVKKNVPQVATIFTTHATSIGRSIAGNNKPLYDYMEGYNGDQMARELNMESKHSVEKQAAHNADCFTTVSDITARECEQLLDKNPDVVLPNGFEDSFVPRTNQHLKKRDKAREVLFRIANALMGTTFDMNTTVVSTSGRYEFRNKGIDMFLDSIMRLRNEEDLAHNVLALIQVPAWQKGVRDDLKKRLESNKLYATPLYMPEVTHELCDPVNDRVMSMLRYNNMHNTPGGKVSIMFVPSYLDGNDGLFNIPYYDLINASDLCIYPSYYEPWGYTPLEAVAFGIPCITTTLAGFGMWALKTMFNNNLLSQGVKVIERTDSNYEEAVNEIRDLIIDYSRVDHIDRFAVRQSAMELSRKALWDKFIKYYKEAYSVALNNRNKRNNYV